jgi:hypothetical protein
MWNRFTFAVALLAATPLVAPDPDTSTTVFHGTQGTIGSAAEIPAYGSSAKPGYTSSAGGTTVFHGTPSGTPGPWPGSPPPWMPPGSAARWRKLMLHSPTKEERAHVEAN